MTPAERSEALRSGEVAALALDKVPFAEAKASILEDWAKADTLDRREALHSELKALDRVTSRLWASIQNAKVAAMEIKAEQTALTGKVDPYENG